MSVKDIRWEIAKLQLELLVINARIKMILEGK